jgi:hypothetical protein
MRPLIAAIILLGLATAACGGGNSAEAAWCEENPDIVLDAADDMGLVDYVFSYYESAGDGLDSNGEPVQTDRNIEVSEDLRARNAENPDALIDFLYAEYLKQDAGKEACAAAYAEEGS